MQRMRLHPCLYAGILLHLLALSAVIADLLRGLHHRLVSAPSQRHIDGSPGKFIILRIGQPVQPDPDADGNRHLISDIYGLHIVQDLKALLTHLRDRPLAQDHQVLVLLNLPADAIEAGNIFVDLSFDQRREQGPAYLLHAFQRLVVIIQIDQPNRKGLVVVFLQGDLQRRLIEQIHGEQTAFIIRVLNDIAVVGGFPQGDPGKLRGILAVPIGKLKLRPPFFLGRQPVPGH